jgi:hypothetical protein
VVRTPAPSVRCAAIRAVVTAWSLAESAFRSSARRQPRMGRNAVRTRARPMSSAAMRAVVSVHPLTASVPRRFAHPTLLVLHVALRHVRVERCAATRAAGSAPSLTALAPRSYVGRCHQRTTLGQFVVRQLAQPVKSAATKAVESVPPLEDFVPSNIADRLHSRSIEGPRDSSLSPFPSWFFICEVTGDTAMC